MTNNSFGPDFPYVEIVFTIITDVAADKLEFTQDDYIKSDGSTNISSRGINISSDKKTWKITIEWSAGPNGKYVGEYDYRGYWDDVRAYDTKGNVSAWKPMVI
jgi:hypothetical protein